MLSSCYPEQIASHVLSLVYRDFPAFRRLPSSTSTHVALGPEKAREIMGNEHLGLGGEQTFKGYREHLLHSFVLFNLKCEPWLSSSS